MKKREDMRIVYVVPVSWGGILHYSACLANGVAELADVTVLKAKDKNTHLFSQKVRIIECFDEVVFSRGNPVGSLSLRNVKAFFTYRKINLVRKLKPDIVHYPELYPYATLFSKLSGLDRAFPTVVTLHATFLSPFQLLVAPADAFYKVMTFSTECLKRWIKKDACIVHSDHNREDLIKSGSVGHDKIFVIPHGSYSFYEKFGIPGTKEEAQCVLFFGYIAPKKGLDYLIRACSNISKEKMPHIRLIVAGEGNLDAYSGLLNSMEFIEIHNHYIDEREVAHLFMRATIVVLPYTEHQGNSGVLSTAIAFKKPVIVTDAGDFPKLIRDGQDGLVVPVKDVTALAEAIINLLQNRDLRLTMRDNLEKKSEELSWENIAKGHMEVYRKCIRGMS